MSPFRSYRIHGLTVRSALELPELNEAPIDLPVDILVDLGEVSDGLPTISDQGPMWQAGDGQFLLNVPEVARYLVTDGKQVRIDPEPGVAPGDIRVYLLGAVLGVVLHQRGLLALHAGAIEMNGQAVAFAGYSGVGKSTLVAHLLQRGYRLIGDDLLAIRLDREGQPWAQPSFPRIKLWVDALSHIRHQPDRLVRDYSRLEKFHLAVEEGLVDLPLPLARVYLLEENRLGDEIIMESLRGLEAVNALAQITYRPQHVKALGLGQRQFQQCSQTANRIQVVRLCRPKSLDHMEDVLDRVALVCCQNA